MGQAAGRQAFTLTELLVVLALLSLLLPFAYRIWSVLRRGSDQVSEHARYYQVVGRFLAQFKLDLRSATRLRREGDSLVITVPADDPTAERTIRYSVDADRHRLSRSEGGQAIVFDFGAPPAGAGPFIFRIE
ncbi:MAG: hypothetical protein OZSIB_1637 [Candidatus Ozemobacter sibiricus]|uniref:Prepilin-type N-terminal cleavage/methylation domain-containing protein n=1 Tax=Candidatus Ozemobacter sibiricus TaxID=2268124 RepID=A0A367ZJQ1_9BACT|nr:MAG: hypothetical protein OZSIB_1637 [Candidatus Ozemobacter sibiricus]